MRIPDSKLVDMKYTAAEKKEESKEMSAPVGSNMPDYPWGLCLDLNDESLKKLGISTLPEVGDEYHLIGVAKVTRLSSSASETYSEDSMSLQICFLQLVHEDEKPDEKESASEENKENRTGVQSVLTNSMR